MGYLRESYDPEEEVYRMVGLYLDKPINSDILIDDITRNIFILKGNKIEVLSYSEYWEFCNNGIRGGIKGNNLKNTFIRIQNENS